MVGGRGGTQFHAPGEQRLDRVVICDGTRVGLGCLDVHRKCSRQPNRVRGDSVAVRDVGEVLVEPGGIGDPADGDDCGAAGRECE
jgi:hypothetical protein